MVVHSRRLNWTEYVVRIEESRTAFKILTGKPIGNRSLGRSRSRSKENIRTDLQK